MIKRLRTSTLSWHSAVLGATAFVVLVVVGLAFAADFKDNEPASIEAKQVVQQKQGTNVPKGSDTSPSIEANGLKSCPPRGSKAVNFSTYHLGAQFDGLPLEDVHRVCRKPFAGEPFRGNNVSYIYGTCTPVGDTGCRPPLVVQSAPACERNPSLYPSRFPRERLTTQGVPAAYFDDAKRLELYTGDSTVVIFGSNREQVFAASRALRSLPEAQRPAQQPAVSPGDHLPEPVSGALEGKLAC
jgi:hypothetical protein